MAVEYSKKTNAELIEILKSRSLPYTGKKADMVARLQEADKTEASKATTTAAPAKTGAVEDEIDWEDDAPAPDAPAQTTASTAAATEIKQVPNPTVVENQKVDIDPSTTHDLKVGASEDTTAGGDAAAAPEGENGTAVEAEEKGEEKPAVDYSIGLAQTDLEAELAKRKARAEKFGIVEDTATALEETKKALERAKRFGTAAEDGTISVKGLDQALSSDRPRKRGRGGDDGESGGRGGKRRDFRGRGRGRQGGRGGRRGPAPAPRQENGWSEGDRAALEKRKNRFG
ncbi:hypothetical protein FQN52_001817 [Onygenales sp. PD_12]|nr:hypothetical protein FQN53_007781 [Emmonsiellopsis sp. PD_33]KAK2793171.1 hypothetical protein FQN52_001817 [Onygenales sp. PD_12]